MSLDQIRRLLNQFWVFAASAFLLVNHKALTALVASLVSKDDLGHWYYAFLPQNRFPQNLESLSKMGIAGLIAEFLLLGCIRLSRGKCDTSHGLISGFVSACRKARRQSKGNCV